MQGFQPRWEELFLQQLTERGVSHEAAPSKNSVQRSHLLCARIDFEIAVKVLSELRQNVEENEGVPFASGEDLDKRSECYNQESKTLWEKNVLTVFQSLSSSGMASLTFHRFITSPTRILASSRI